MKFKAVVLIFLLMVLLPAKGFSQDLAYLDKELGYSAKSLLETKASLDFKNIDIVEALKFLSQKAGMNIIPTNKVSGRISLSVDDASLKDVFDIMLRSNGLAYDKKGDIYNVMTEEEYKSLYGKKFNDLRKVRVFHLKYAVPEQVFALCDRLKSGIGKVMIDAESGNLLVMDTPHNINRIEKVINSLEQKTTVLKVYDLKYANAKAIATQLKNQLDVKKVGTIRADERSNQVIVQALPQRIKDVEKLIGYLDRKTRQVLMDVKIVKVKMSDALNKGIEWEGLFNLGKRYGMTYLGSYPFSAVQASTDAWRSRKQVLDDVGYVGSYPFSGTTLDYASGTKTSAMENVHLGMVGKHDFDAIFNYFLNIGNTKVVANPKTAVIENQEARIHIGERQAYITNTTTQTTSTTTIAEEVTFIDVGIKLFIIPTINEDGYITLKIKPEISSVVSYLETAAGNKIPILNTSSAETTVIAKNGSTILIGGLKQEKETDMRKEIPFLNKIPVIGSFMGTSTKVDECSEFLVLVTPYIITGDELTTGRSHDFGHRLDKEDQQYSGFPPVGIEYRHKSYRDYDSLRKEEMLEIKPVK